MRHLCNVCGSRLITRFPEVIDPATGEAFAVKKCVECGLGHTLPQPEDPGRYYGTVYYGNRHGITSAFCTRRRLRFVAAFATPSAGGRLLDIGCGDGTFLIAAKEAGWEVMGIEVHPEPARAAGLDVREAIEQVPDGILFDCITMWHSLEHMRDFRSALSQISMRLKPDGKLLIAVPDNSGHQALFMRHKWLHLDVPRHLYHFDAGSLAASLTSAGFAVQKQWHQELEYDLIGWSQSALNCIFPEPNAFFDFITGKQRNHGALFKVTSFVLGSILTALSLPAVAAGTLSGRGGTLITLARRETAARKGAKAKKI